MDKPCEKCVYKDRSSYQAPCTLCHQWGRRDNFKPISSLKFTCVTCGQHVLECIMDNGYSSIVTYIDVDGNFEYDNDAVDSDLAYYQCDHCGAHIVYENGLDIQDDEEIVEYIKKNCKQEK